MHNRVSFMLLIFTDFAAVDSSFGTACLYLNVCTSVFWGWLWGFLQKQSLFEVCCNSSAIYMQRLLFYSKGNGKGSKGGHGVCDGAACWVPGSQLRSTHHPAISYTPRDHFYFTHLNSSKNNTLYKARKANLVS